MRIKRDFIIPTKAMSEQEIDVGGSQILIYPVFRVALTEQLE